MEKHSAALWENVHALLIAAMGMLHGEFAEKYFYKTQMLLRQAENVVRETFAGMAMQMSLKPLPVRAETKPSEKPKAKKRNSRSFAVLPSGLKDYDYSYLPATPFDVPNPFETKLNTLQVRVDLLEAVMASPDRHARRLARIFMARDPIGVALRFLGVGIALPKEQVRKYLPPLDVVPFQNSA